MKKSTFLGLAVALVVAGVVSGQLAGDLFQPAPFKTGKAMWAFNYESLGQMARDVDAVVIATAQGSYPGRVVRREGSPNSIPFTLTDFVVEARIGGEVPDVFTIERTGGLTDDGMAFDIDDGGPYREGQQYLLFLREQEESLYYILPNPQARFRVSDTDRLEAVSPERPGADRLDGLSVIQAVRAIEREL